jgi:hypothetical protein
MDRFFAKVDADGVCWEWTGALDRRGYGVAYRGPGKGAGRAHRICYEWLVGEIPDGLVLDHLCRVPRCVNPDHLEPVSNRENLVRGYGFAGMNARKETCPQGHRYDRLEKNRHGYMARACSVCDRGGQPALPRLDLDQVEAIRASFAAGGVSRTALGRQYGIGNDVVARIVNGQQNTAIVFAIPHRVVREWAKQAGKNISDRGRIPQEIVDEWRRTAA